MMSTPTLKDVVSDIRYLYHLVDTICDVRFSAPGEMYRERVDALLWVSRDLAERVKRDVSVLADEIEFTDGPRMTGGQRNG